MYIYDQHLSYPRVMLYDVLKAMGYQRTGFFLVRK